MLWSNEISGRQEQDLDDATRAIEAWLLLGARASRGDNNSDNDRVLRPRLHLFARGLQHPRPCTNPDCGALVERGQKACCVCGACSRPLKVCRHCGQDFFGLFTGEQVPLNGTQVLPFYDDAHDEEDEGEDSELGLAGPEAGDEDGERWKAGPVHMVWKLHDTR